MFEDKRLENRIKNRGVEYTFNRYALNQFKERSNTSINISKLKGLFHNQVSYMDIVGTDPVRKQKTFTPMILVTHKDFQLNPLQIDDEVLFNGKKYKVTGFNDFEESNYGVDISLQVIL